MSNEMSLEQAIKRLEFDTCSAQKWADAGKIEQWVHEYLLSGSGGRSNSEFSEGLKREKRWWNEPIELNLTDLSPAVGTEPGLEFVVMRIVGLLAQVSWQNHFQIHYPFRL